MRRGGGSFFFRAPPGPRECAFNGIAIVHPLCPSLRLLLSDFSAQSRVNASHEMPSRERFITLAHGEQIILIQAIAREINKLREIQEKFLVKLYISGLRCSISKIEGLFLGKKINSIKLLPIRLYSAQ